MFKRDLIARYGAGHGVRENELRKALAYRRKLIGFVSVAGLGLLSLLFMVDPWAPLWALLVIGGLGLVIGLFAAALWFVDNWNENITRIQHAKEYGVLEDHRG